MAETPEQVAERILRSTHGITVHRQRLGEEIAAALRAAAVDRDLAWWEALVLNDAAAPTPEAAKLYLLGLQDEVRKEAERAGAERMREIVAADALLADALDLVEAFGFGQQFTADQRRRRDEIAAYLASVKGADDAKP